MVVPQWPLKETDPYWSARAEVASDVVPILVDSAEGYVVESSGTLDLDSEVAIGWTEEGGTEGSIFVVLSEVEPGLVGFDVGVESEFRFRMRLPWDFGCR